MESAQLKAPAMVAVMRVAQVPAMTARRASLAKLVLWPGARTEMRLDRHFEKGPPRVHASPEVFLLVTFSADSVSLLPKDNQKHYLKQRLKRS